MDDQSKPDPEREPSAGDPSGPRPDAPKPDAPAQPVDDDATQLVNPDPDATRLVRPGDATTVLRPEAPDATSIMRPLPPMPGTTSPGTGTSASGLGAGSERWSAKANVPRGRPPRDPDATAQWDPPEPGRVWWLPIMLAIIGLILLVGIVYAVITVLTKSSDNPPTPAPPPSPTAPTTAAPTTPTSPGTPSSVLPSTPTPAGTATVPSTLVGLPLNEAESILDGLGIAYTTAPQPDDTTLPNTVVNTSPAAGQLVPDGGSVTLYYAQPSAPSSPATPSISTSAGSGSPSS